MPPMKATGMNTAARISAMPTTGPDTSSIACSVASRGDMPSSMWCSTASTTTIASSTTRPIASTSPKSDSVLIEKPSSGKTTKVPISDTGTVRIGISVARQFCRKTKTTRMTSEHRLEQRDDDLADAFRHGARGVERVADTRGRTGSAPRSASICARTPSATASALEPGAWKMAIEQRRLAVGAADLLIVERAELDARDVLQADTEPSGFARTTIVAELSSVCRRPCARTV